MVFPGARGAKPGLKRCDQIILKEALWEQYTKQFGRVLITGRDRKGTRAFVVTEIKSSLKNGSIENFTAQ